MSTPKKKYPSPPPKSKRSEPSKTGTRTRATAKKGKNVVPKPKAALRMQVSNAQLPEWRAECKRKFLAAFAEWGNISAGCQAAGIGRKTYYEWTDERNPIYDPEFAQGVIDAREAVIDALEQKAFQRADDKSDLMMIFTLKNNRERYAEKPSRVELTGKDGGPVGYIDVKEELLKKLQALGDRRGTIVEGSERSVEVHQLKRA